MSEYNAQETNIPIVTVTGQDAVYASQTGFDIPFQNDGYTETRVHMGMRERKNMKGYNRIMKDRGTTEYVDGGEYEGNGSM